MVYEKKMCPICSGYKFVFGAGLLTWVIKAVVGR